MALRECRGRGRAWTVWRSASTRGPTSVDDALRLVVVVARWLWPPTRTRASAQGDPGLKRRGAVIGPGHCVAGVDVAVGVAVFVRALASHLRTARVGGDVGAAGSCPGRQTDLKQGAHCWGLSGRAAPDVCLVPHLMGQRATGGTKHPRRAGGRPRGGHRFPGRRGPGREDVIAGCLALLLTLFGAAGCPVLTLLDPQSGETAVRRRLIVYIALSAQRTKRLALRRGRRGGCRRWPGR